MGIIMGYNQENYRRIREEYESKPQKARDAANKRCEELHERFEDVARIDRILSETGLKIFGEAMKGREGLDERINKLKAENEELRNVRAQILIANGYPADYSSVRYECERCRDTGFIGTKMCDCMKQKLIAAGYESSGIGRLMRTQSFETFNLEKCRQSPEQYNSMRLVFNESKKFAESFEPGNGQNLLFLGTTGLGKTHLSTSIAKVVIERGFDVFYDTFQNIIRELEKEHFGRSEEANEYTGRLFGCDLLIIDDLGTELTNQFTISALYNLINTRLNSSRSMIINTNLRGEDILPRYGDRIASRIFGEFSAYVFIGRDLRIEEALKRLRKQQ